MNLLKTKTRLAMMLTGVIIVIGGGTVYVNSGGGGGGGGGLGGVSVANLWITKPGDSAGSCTRAGTAAAYSQSASCGGTQFFNQAYLAASAGDTIGIPGGTLPSVKQIIDFRSGFQNFATGCDPTGAWGSVSTTNCVRFAPKTGEQSLWPFPVEVHAGSIWIDGSSTGNVGDPGSRTFSFQELGEFDTESDSGTNYPDHITITGFKVSDMVTYGTHNLRFSQGETGDYYHNGTSSDCASDQNFTGAHDNDTGTNFAAFESHIGGRNGVIDTNIEWDHIYLHDVNTNADPACDPHDGCLFINSGVDGLTLDSDVWEQCWVYDIQNQAQSGVTPTTNVTIENSWFGVGVESLRDFGNKTTAGQRGLQFDSTGGQVNNVNITNGSSTLTVSSGGFPGVNVGDYVTGGGTDILAGTTVSSISGNSLVMSQNAIFTEQQPVVFTFPASRWSNYLVRFNSFSDQGSSNCATANCVWVNTRFIGNTGAIPAQGPDQVCGGGGITFDKDTWDGGTCSGNDTSFGGSTQYVNGTIGTQDFHLANGTSTANNIVTPTSSDYTLTKDIDGDARTAGSRDAGSDEH